MGKRKNISHTERVTTRITMDQTEALEEIVQKEGLGSKSDAIREAIDEYIEGRSDPRGTQTVSTKVPKKVLEELDKLVEDGTIMDREEGVRIALRHFVMADADYFVNRVPEMDKKRLETATRSYESHKDAQP